MTHMIAVPNGVVPCTSCIRTCTYKSVQVIVQMTKLYVQVATFQAAFVSSSAAMKS